MNKYFYVSDGQSKGPASPSDLLEYGIDKSTLVWTDGMSEWGSAGSVPDIAKLFTPTQPPIPMSAAIPTPPPIPTSSDSSLSKSVSDPTPAERDAALEEKLNEEFMNYVRASNKLEFDVKANDDSEKATISDVLGCACFVGIVYGCCKIFPSFATKYYGWWIFGFCAFVLVAGTIMYLFQLAKSEPLPTVNNTPYIPSTGNNSKPMFRVAVEDNVQYSGEHYIKQQTQYQPQQYKQERGEVIECKWCGNELNMRGSAKANYGGWDVCSQKCRKELSASIGRGEMRVKNYFLKRLAKWAIFFIVLLLIAIFNH